MFLENADFFPGKIMRLETDCMSQHQDRFDSSHNNIISSNNYNRCPDSSVPGVIAIILPAQ